MVTTFEPSGAVVIIAAMVTPALLILASAAHSLSWLPIGLAITGTLALLVGGALMVAESRLGGEQVSQEIRRPSFGWAR